MPEYLAPGVYVEEIDTGSKPIEGVSTSTAGMVGVTERGPVNVPILITSYGEYVRWFGGRLRPDMYSNGNDPLCYLPYSIEGFFTNGGKRVYITRVLEYDKAAPASTLIFDRSAPVPATSSLVSPITSGSLSTAYLIDLAGMAPAMPRLWLQIGTGGVIEFAKLDALPGNETDVKLDLPLAFDHPSTDPVVRLTNALPNAADQKLQGTVSAGLMTITLTAPVVSLSSNAFIEIRSPGATTNDAEIVQVANVNGAVVDLRVPLLFTRSAGDEVRIVDIAATANPTTIESSRPALASDSVIHLPAFDRTNYTTTNLLMIIGAGPTAEVRRTSAIVRLPLTLPLVRDYERGTSVESVTETLNATIRKLEKDVEVGATVVWLNKRNGLADGDRLRIRLSNLDSDVEYAQIKNMPNRASTGDDPGMATLELPVAKKHPSQTETKMVRTVVRNTIGIAGLAVSALTNARSIEVSAAMSAAVSGSLIMLYPAGGAPTLHRLSAVPQVLTPRLVTLVPPLTKPHAAGSIVASTVPLFEVRALDAGQWGNRLRVAVREPEKSTVDSMVRFPGALGAPDGTHIRLESANGVEVGTVLQKWDSATKQFVGNPFKVISVDRQNGFLLTLDSTQVLTPGDVLRSREFNLDVFLLRQPDMANPSRDNAVIFSESFSALTLDPRHSRYLHKIVGTTWDMQARAQIDDEGNSLRISDRRSEGESTIIRVRDSVFDLPPTNQQAAREKARVGPRFDMETLSDGRTRPTRYALRLGDDAISSFNDDTYMGRDNVDPDLRSGLETLRNIEEISIVAAPGRTSPKMQNALINHCELMRYRFAVLDGNPPPKDTMADIQNQRQQFDTKYAALYHPWLLMLDPYPETLGVVPDYPIPPSGHMVGVYARTDIERGVHKAPANEVVRGITGLQRKLNKEQHDILNPYPVNINVIRDFRDNNRGIRVYGGRVITSDSDWKYVNVRRLMIFVENSIDRGLQWVVFEPNAEPLWARVRRSISNFLTLVWRNGALEGTKPEEAFFVKCDRTTMTQTDIDSGRLICVIGIAPVKPAEFVIVRIGLWTAHADE